MPEVIDLRLRILTNLGKWEPGDSLADALQHAFDDEGDGRYKITCAQSSNTMPREKPCRAQRRGGAAPDTPAAADLSLRLQPPPRTRKNEHANTNTGNDRVESLAARALAHLGRAMERARKVKILSRT